MKANQWSFCHSCCKGIRPGQRVRVLRLKGERFTRWAHGKCPKTPQEGQRS